MANRLDRNDIAKIVGNNPIAIREFERLLSNVQANITGMSVITLDYASDGTLSTPIPALYSYTLAFSDGTVARSGVSWGVVVTSGTFSGAAPTMGGTSTGLLQLNSGIASPTVTIAITARVNGRGYPAFTVMIQRAVAAVDGGTAGTSSMDTTATFTTFSTATFVAITRSLVITTPALATQAVLTAPLLSLGVASDAPSGDSTVEIKWQRETAPSVWTDVGVFATSSPDPSVTEYVEPDAPTFYSPTYGSVTCNRTETGLVAATQYTFRLVARVSAGNLRGIIPSGAVTVTS